MTQVKEKWKWYGIRDKSRPFRNDSHDIVQVAIGEAGDGASSGGTYTGNYNKNFKLEIDEAENPDKFKWSNDGGTTWEEEEVVITGAAQNLEDGVTINFDAVDGHDIGDSWTFTAYAATVIFDAIDVSGFHGSIHVWNLGTKDVTYYVYCTNIPPSASRVDIGDENWEKYWVLTHKVAGIVSVSAGDKDNLTWSTGYKAIGLRAIASGGTSEGCKSYGEVFGPR